MALRVEVVSPAGEAWTGEATQVSVPLINGEMGILPGRQPLVAVLGAGPVRLSPIDGETCSIEVSGGFCSVDHDVITIAADHVKQGAEASFRLDSLEWYRLVSFSTRPSRSWSRLNLELSEARRRREQGRVVEVHCVDATRSPEGFDLAMMEESHSALVAWVESAAPEQPRLF